MVEKLKRKKILLQILLGAVVLMSGVAIGAGGVVLLEKNDIIRIRRHHHKHDVDEIIEYLAEKYELSAEQKVKVRNLLEESLAKKETAREEMVAKIKAQRERLIVEMEKILTPEQFERWHEDFLEWIEKTKKRHRKD